MGCSSSKDQVSDTKQNDYHAMFKEADKNNSGNISEEELYDYLQSKGFNVTRDLIHRTAAAFDDNGNGKMDEKEFVDLMTRLAQ